MKRKNAQKRETIFRFRSLPISVRENVAKALKGHEKVSRVTTRKLKNVPCLRVPLGKRPVHKTKKWSTSGRVPQFLLKKCLIQSSKPKIVPHRRVSLTVGFITLKPLETDPTVPFKKRTPQDEGYSPPNLKGSKPNFENSFHRTLRGHPRSLRGQNGDFPKIFWPLKVLWTVFVLPLLFQNMTSVLVLSGLCLGSWSCVQIFRMFCIFKVNKHPLLKV